MFTKTLNNFKFQAPSKRKGKKYDVYNKDGKYICSFGALGYQQYKDRIGYYSKSDHLDKDRRRLYQQRHQKDLITDKTKPGYFAWFYLW